MDTKFRIYLDKSNFQISALVIRSLVYDEKKGRLLFDSIRLKDEMLFYKHIVQHQKPSIISALYPLIYGNKNIYNGYEEAIKLFISIRRKITAQEQYAIYLLALMIKNGKVNKEDIIQYNIEGLEKQESIKLQKAKVNSIINYEHILTSIFTYLKEDLDYMNIFEYTDQYFFSKNEYKDKLEVYFENLILGKIYSKKYVSKDLKVIEQVFGLSVGTEISCSLIPKGIISKIEKNDREIIINIETPNTSYQLLKKL